MTSRGIVGLVVAGLVGAAVTAGLVMMGSPTEARNRRLDARRVGDLAQIARGVDVFWSRRAVLPASLDELAAELGSNPPLRDPESGQAYDYRPLDANRYELCAVFATESEGEPRGANARFWVHGRGLACFAVTAERTEREPRQPIDQVGTGTGT